MIYQICFPLTNSYALERCAASWASPGFRRSAPAARPRAPRAPRAPRGPHPAPGTAREVPGAAADPATPASFKGKHDEELTSNQIYG